MPQSDPYPLGWHLTEGGQIVDHRDLPEYQAGFTDGAMGTYGVMEQRDRWIRLFNRLDAAITHHKKASAGAFATDADEALWKVRDKILKDAAA